MAELLQTLASSGPLAAALTTALAVVWKRLRQREAEITRLHEQQIADFRDLLSKRIGKPWPPKQRDCEESSR